MPPIFDPDATVLITGGTGGLGALLARHLVENQGARRLLLASRRGKKANGASELQSELEAMGAMVDIAACDAADRGQLQALLAKVPPEHPLGAVIHAAGTLDDGLVESLDPERIKHVFAPKVEAAWNLHELTEDLPLSQFVLFSSMAGTLGAPGQGNYAAANAFLDALAQQRLVSGQAAQAIAWGPWEAQSSAMTSGLDASGLARLGRMGIKPLSDSLGTDLFSVATLSGRSVVFPVRFEASNLRARAHEGTLSLLLRGLVGSRGRRERWHGALVRRLAQVPGDERAALILAEILSQIASVLGLSTAEEIDPELTFAELDFDSLDGIELRNRLAHTFGVRLAPTVALDYPTPMAVSSFLSAQVAEERKPVRTGA